jgi:hypothetical protein
MVYKKSSQQNPWFYIILSKKSQFLPEREGNQREGNQVVRERGIRMERMVKKPEMLM